MNDVLQEAENEFNCWYQQQHLPERLGIPGFKTARRYQAIGAGLAYMAVYECQSIDILSSAPYKERLCNPTDWTTKIMPSFRNMLRSACQETWSLGEGVGGTAIVVQCKPLQGKEDDARRYVTNYLAPAIADNLVRMALWEADAGITGGPSNEMVLRGGQDNKAQWVIFIESYESIRLPQVLEKHFPAGKATQHGLQIDSWTVFQLMCHRTSDA